MHAHALLAWQRWELGWVDPSQIRCVRQGQTLTTQLAPLETTGGTKMIVIATSPTTADVVEDRQRIAEDATLCSTGDLVYSVDNTIRNGAGPIRILPAHDDTGVNLQQCGPLADAPLNPGETLTDPAHHLAISVASAAPDGSLTITVQFGT